jgi:hypothetical protein
MALWSQGSMTSFGILISLPLSNSSSFGFSISFLQQYERFRTVAALAVRTPNLIDIDLMWYELYQANHRKLFRLKRVISRR